MGSRSFARELAAIALGAALAAPGTPALAEGEALDLFVGRWEARVETTRPQPAVLTYTEVYEKVLGGKYLQGRTSEKSDGTEDIILGAYDPEARGYPWWLFSSTGTYLFLAPGTWDARSRTLEFRNPPGMDISYVSRVVFRDDRTREWTVLIKDWRGSVVLEQHGRAERR